MLWADQTARGTQNPPGCSANNLNVNIGVRANNITNGTTVEWFVTVQNPALPTSCDVTLGPDGLYFICPGPDGSPTGTRTTLIPGGTTISPGFGLQEYKIPCLVNVGATVRTAQGKVSAPGSVVHKNPLQDDPADVDKTISVNLFQPCIRLTTVCNSAVNPSGSEVTVTYSGTVANCGNVLLTDVWVYNGQTAVFGPVTLQAGATTNFTASYNTTDVCGPYVVSLNALGTAPLDTPVLVTSTASSSCSISYKPAIAVTKTCPVDKVQPGQTLVISGVVSNAGNIALQNVMVYNSQPSADTPLLPAPITLGVGQSVAYTGSYTVPLDSCGPYNDTVRAVGTPVCGAGSVQATATASCPGANTPSIRVTRACPANPVGPGGTLTYTGTVTNTGNITLTEVIVVSDQPSPGTRVFGPLTLAPGGGASFTGSYAVPANSCGPYTGTVTATGKDKCFGVSVSDTASSACLGTSSPGIKVTKTCPAAPVQPGGTLTYSGTVQNTGNISLTNVTVMNGSTVIWGPGSLSAGASASFTASYTVPADSCGPYTDTLVAVGLSACGAPVDNSVTVSCPGANTPSIRVTRACPANPVQPGELLTYTGTVTNTGNITLTNVIVVDSQPAPNTVVFGPVNLAPGTGAIFSGSYNVPVDSCGPYTDTLSASGADRCFGKVVTSTAAGSCPGANVPGIRISQSCPASPASIGGQLVYSATVINTGNITLTDVAVVSDRPSANTTVLRVASLGPGQATNFLGSFTVPSNLNACSITNTLKVTANNKCGGAALTDSVTTACPVIASAAIRVTKTCPATPPATGGLLTFTGTVKNEGNVTLKSISVSVSGPANKVVFTSDSLAPGASAAFNGSYDTPADTCSVTDTLTATATDLCGNVVDNSTTTTCPLGTTSGLVIKTACPETATLPGHTLTFTGWVTNTGNVTLTNVTIVVDRPQANTQFYGPDTLAPGQFAGFYGTFTVPTNVGGCTITYNLNAKGNNKCTGVVVAAATSATCQVVTTPRIVVTKTCPPNPTPQGGTLTYTATVVNAGDVTLKDIVVINNMPAANTVVFRANSLQPGQTTNFTGSYTVPDNCCTVIDTLQARGTDNCTGVGVTNTSSALCPVLFTPKLKITKVCPTAPVKVGEMLVYTGTISNAGNITISDVVVYNRVQGLGQPVLGVVALAPGETLPYESSYDVPVDFCGTDTITVQGLSICGDVYVSDAVTSTCTITTAPAIAVSKTCPAAPIKYGEPVTFTASVMNIGDITLTNVTVVDSMAGTAPVFGPATLAPGQGTNFTFTYTAPVNCNCCELVDTLTARGQDRCTSKSVSATHTTVCPFETHPRILVSLDCPTGSFGQGDLISYSGTVMNQGDCSLTNVVVVSNLPGDNTQVFGPVTLARGEARVFYASYTQAAGTPPYATMKLRASGTGPCSGLLVASEDNCAGNVVVTPPELMDPVINNNVVSLTWSSTPGITYRVQSTSNLQAWQDESGDVIAQGSVATKDVSGGTDRSRFYRVMVVP